MRPPRPRPRDAEAVDALVTDQYLDAVLAGGDGVAVGPHVALGAADAGLADAGVPDAALRRAANVARAALVRVHPSFRFEERLAGRLAALATADTSPAIAAGLRRAAVIPFPGAAVPAVDDPLLAAVLDGRLDPADEEAVARAAGGRSAARPLIVGGAITSAAISLVGVAWVAWRAARPGGPTMSRAAREAHARRLADIAELATSVHGGPA
jgi:hypothetical protein